MGYCNSRNQHGVARQMSEERLLEGGMGPEIENCPDARPVPSPDDRQLEVLARFDPPRTHGVQRVSTVPLSHTVVPDPFCYPCSPPHKHHSARSSPSLSKKASKHLLPYLLAPFRNRHLTSIKPSSVPNIRLAETHNLTRHKSSASFKPTSSPHQSSITSRHEGLALHQSLYTRVQRVTNDLVQSQGLTDSDSSDDHFDLVQKELTKTPSVTSESLISLYQQIPSSYDPLAQISSEESREFSEPDTPDSDASHTLPLDIIDLYASLETENPLPNHSKAPSSRLSLPRRLSTTATSINPVKMSSSENSNATAPGPESHSTPTRQKFDDLQTAYSSITSKSMRSTSPVNSIEPQPSLRQLTPVQHSDGALPVPVTRPLPAKAQPSASYHYMPPGYRSNHEQSKGITGSATAKTLHTPKRNNNHSTSEEGYNQAHALTLSARDAAPSNIEGYSSPNQRPDTAYEYETPSKPSASLMPAGLRISRTRTTDSTHLEASTGRESLGSLALQTPTSNLKQETPPSYSKRALNILQSTFRSVGFGGTDNTLEDTINQRGLDQDSSAHLLRAKASRSTVAEADLERGLSSYPSLDQVAVPTNMIDDRFSPRMNINANNAYHSTMPAALHSKHATSANENEFELQPIGACFGSTDTSTLDRSSSIWPATNELFPPSNLSVEHGRGISATDLDEHAYLSPLVQRSSNSAINQHYNSTYNHGTPRASSQIINQSELDLRNPDGAENTSASLASPSMFRTQRLSTMVHDGDHQMLSIPDEASDRAVSVLDLQEESSQAARTRRSHMPIGPPAATRALGADNENLPMSAFSATGPVFILGNYRESTTNLLGSSTHLPAPVHPGRPSLEHIHHYRSLSEAERQQFLLPTYAYQGSTFPNRNALTNPLPAHAETDSSTLLHDPFVLNRGLPRRLSLDYLASQYFAAEDDEDDLSFTSGSSPRPYRPSYGPIGGGASSAQNTAESNNDTVQSRTAEVAFHRSSGLDVISERASEYSISPQKPVEREESSAWVTDDESIMEEVEETNTPANRHHTARNMGDSTVSRFYQANPHFNGTPLSDTNSFKQRSLTGTYGNATGTPNGTNMRFAGSSVVGSSDGMPSSVMGSSPPVLTEDLAGLSTQPNAVEYALQSKKRGKLSFLPDRIVSASSSSPFATVNVMEGLTTASLAGSPPLPRAVLRDSYADEMNRRSQEARRQMFAASHRDDYVVRNEAGDLVPALPLSATYGEDGIVDDRGEGPAPRDTLAGGVGTAASGAAINLVAPWVGMDTLPAANTNTRRTMSYSPHLLPRPSRGTPQSHMARTAHRIRVNRAVVWLRGVSFWSWVGFLVGLFVLVSVVLAVSLPVVESNKHHH